MKKTFITILITIFLINITFAQKKDHNYEMYIGNKIGWSKYNDLQKINTKFGNIYEYNNEKGTGIFIGYKNNKYISFELGYDWLGKIVKDKKFTSNFFKSEGINLVNKINLPINSKIDLYTRIGSIITKSIYNEKNKIKKKQINYTDIRLSPLFSIGLEYKMNSSWTSRLDYQIIPNIGNKFFLNEEPNNNFLNISFLYKYKKNNIKNFNKKYIHIKMNKNINNNLYLNKTLDKIIFLNKNIYRIKIINYYLPNKINKFNYIKLIYNNINDIEKYFLNKGIDNIKISKKIYNLNKFKNIKKQEISDYINNTFIKIKIIK